MHYNDTELHSIEYVHSSIATMLEIYGQEQISEHAILVTGHAAC